ncbi:MAG: aminotransferase [Pikeienuella sp.]
MTMPATNPLLAGVTAPPVMEARRWLEEIPQPDGLPLLNLAQAAPVDPPPERLRAAMAASVAAPGAAHLYGAVLGDEALRAQIAADWSQAYRAEIGPDHVAVTAGCNQAFCAAMATLCAPGDAVLMPVPWYFNHKMWLDMCGVAAIPLACGPDLLPNLSTARAQLTPRTRALALVSPNNPTGVEYPAAFLDEAFELCRDTGLALVLDETYRDFHSAEGPPHGLFDRPDWTESFVHLYSFSKVFRLTGHRTGALIAGTDRLAQAEKFLDTVTICPPRTGQVAALAGLRELRPWVAGERAEILARGEAVRAVFAGLPGWRLRGAGAYFAWVEPPETLWPGTDGTDLARRLLAERAVLTLPGAMFGPKEGDWGGARALRIAYANVDAVGIAELGLRLRDLPG